MTGRNPASYQQEERNREPAATWYLRHALREPGSAAVGGNRTFSAADWDQVVLVAERHAVSPLLYARAQASSMPIAVPDAVREAWRLSFLQHAARNALLYGELREILNRFQAAGIPSIVLKGGCLAATVYAHIGHRPMNDLDLLVPPGQLVAATQLVRQMGYSFQRKPVFTDALLASPGWQSRIPHHHESRLHKPPVSAVELHWNLAVPRSGMWVDLEGLWRRSQPVTLGNLSARTLSPEDLLLHLCLHATRGQPDALAFGLRPFCDLAALIRTRADVLDWATLTARAREWRVARGVGVALALAKELLGVPVPDACLRDLGVAAFDAGRRAVALRQLWSQGKRDPAAAPATLWVPEMGRLAARPGVWRWRALIRRVFPGRTYWPETDAFRRGVPYSWSSHGRHVGTKLRQFAQLLAYIGRHPGRAVAGLRTSREEAHFSEWLRGEAPRAGAVIARSRADSAGAAPVVAATATAKSGPHPTSS